MPCAAFKSVNQQSDADHFAVTKGMGETEERCGDHAPRNEIVTRRNVETDRPAGRQEHHQYKNCDKEETCRIAREQIKPIEPHTHGSGRIDACAASRSFAEALNPAENPILVCSSPGIGPTKSTPGTPVMRVATTTTMSASPRATTSTVSSASIGLSLPCIPALMPSRSRRLTK